MDPQYGEEIVSESGLDLITLEAFYREAQKLEMMASQLSRNEFLAKYLGFLILWNESGLLNSNGNEGLYEKTYKIRIAKILQKADRINYKKDSTVRSCVEAYDEDFVIVDEVDWDEELLNLSEDYADQGSLPRGEEFTF